MNLPNALSILRILMVPLFIAVYFGGSPNSHIWATVVFLLAGLTDIIDGRIARRLGQITMLGRILDPLADKLMVFAALICCVLSGFVPVWVVILFFVKEVAQGVCGLLLYRKIKDMPPSNTIGKIGTTCFYITIAVTILFDINIILSYAMLTVSFVMIFSAFFSYLINGVKLGRQNPEIKERLQ